MTSTKLITIASLCVMACSLAHSEETAAEWRVLGPAFSYHFTRQGALSSHGPVTWSCNASHVYRPSVSGGSNILAPQVTPYKTFKVATTPYVVTTAQDYMGNTIKVDSPIAQVTAALDGPGVFGRWNYTSDNKHAAEYSVQTSYANSGNYMESYNQVTCDTTGFSEPVKETWHQNNPAFGIERAWRYGDHIDKAYLSYVRDSYGTPSVLGAVARQWPLATVGSFSFEGGAMAGLWRRSELDHSGYELRRMTIPFVLPVLTINEETTGIGMDVAMVPRSRIGHYYLSSTTTLMFQLTYLIHRSESKQGLAGVSLQTTPEGGAQASFGYAF